MVALCKIDGCMRPTKTRELCSMHYKRLWRTGDVRPDQPSKIEMYEAAREHFLATVGIETDDCIVWPYRLHRGYGMLGNERVHVLACERTHGPRPTGMVACHGPCHNRACYNQRHVSWGTSKQNADDRSRDGTKIVGELHARSKLADTEVLSIRDSYASGRLSQQKLASRYGVSQVMISKIILEKKWRHLL